MYTLYKLTICIHSIYCSIYIKDVHTSGINIYSLSMNNINMLYIPII